MPQLDWSEHAFIECLEVLPAAEHQAEHRFTVVQTDLTLTLTVWQYESVVAVEITRSETGASVIAFLLAVRGVARHLKGVDSECIEFVNAVLVPSRFSYSEYEQQRVNLYNPEQIPGLRAVRLFIKPGIRIEIPRDPRPL